MFAWNATSLPLRPALDLDPDPAIYVSGTDGRICRIDTAANVTLFATLSSAIDGLTYAGGLVTAINQGLATQFKLDGSVAGTLGSAGSLLPIWKLPIAVSPSGDLIATGFTRANGYQFSNLMDVSTSTVLLSNQSPYPGACATGSSLCGPDALVFEPVGTLLIADSGAKVISRWNGQALSVVAGTSGVGGHADGPALQATFGRFGGMARDWQGNLFALDAEQGLLRKVDMAGAVSTIAGVPHVRGADSGAAIGASLSSPVACLLVPGAAGDGCGSRRRPKPRSLHV